MASLFEMVGACHQRIDTVASHYSYVEELLASLTMTHFRILEDSRIKTAIAAVEMQLAPNPMNFLNIIVAVLGNLPALATDINNPAALVALILSFLAPPIPAVVVHPAA